MAEIGNVTVRVDAVITDEQYCEAMGAVRAANKRMDLLAAENAKLRELLLGLLSSHDKMCTQRGNCFGCQFFDTGRFSDVCQYFKLSQSARELGIEVGA